MPLGLFGLFIPPGRGNGNAVGSFGLCCRINAAADCLALRISPNWDLENAMSPRHLKDPLF
jgi:hypothetical protein